jgi:uncharacterized protein (TIGR03067 family)
MKLKVLALLVFAGLLLGADAPRDAEQLLGTWKVISAEDSGRKASEENIKNLKWTVARDAITYTYKVGKTTRWTYKLDPARKPKWIDLTEGDRTRLAIYHLDGDTLKVCFAEGTQKERPTAFESKPNSPNDVLIVLRREKSTSN